MIAHIFQSDTSNVLFLTEEIEGKTKIITLSSPKTVFSPMIQQSSVPLTTDELLEGWKKNNDSTYIRSQEVWNRDLL
jgi:hypothetical protein